MANHSWVLDAPTGTYKNHKLSSEIRMASIKECKFMPFVSPEPGYGKNNGESVLITRVSNVTVPTNDVLDERERIPEDEISLSTQSITVAERGRAIPYTSLALDLGHFDLENKIQKKLKQQLKLSMDIKAADAFKAGQIKAIPDGVASLTFDTDGTASTTATAGMNVYHVEQLRDYMFGTLAIEPYMDDDYICILATKSKRSIVNDPKWEQWKKYTDPSAKFNGEIGRMENIRFIESNHFSALSNSLGTGSVLGEAVVFGMDPVSMAVAEDPHLRIKNPTDYGRDKGVAWYGIYGYDQIWKDSANSGEARVIHVTSA